MNHQKNSQTYETKITKKLSKEILDRLVEEFPMQLLSDLPLKTKTKFSRDSQQNSRTNRIRKRKNLNGFPRESSKQLSSEISEDFLNTYIAKGFRGIS